MGGGGGCTPMHLPSSDARFNAPLPASPPLNRYIEVGADGFVPRWEAPAFLSGVLPGLAHAAVLTERWVGV